MRHTDEQINEAAGRFERLADDYDPSTDRDAIRREVAAEVIERAEKEAAGHYALLEQAREHGKVEMAARAEHAVNAWRGVADRLRLEYGIPEDG